MLQVRWYKKWPLLAVGINEGMEDILAYCVEVYRNIAFKTDGRCTYIQYLNSIYLNEKLSVSWASLFYLK